MRLELEDGSVYLGYSFGAEVEASGECVFQTGMVGYPESLTDPSYQKQILILTYPLIGNYGVPNRKTLEHDLPKHFESNKIHVSALIVGIYDKGVYSHYLAESELACWLKENQVTGIFGLDTRALTKRIREKGVMLGRIVFKKESELPWLNPNVLNLVEEVSVQTPKVYSPHPDIARTLGGRPLRVLAVDVGMKFNQIRCFLKRGVELVVVPWNYDILSSKEHFDGIFISNGPGDPVMVKETITMLKSVLEAKKWPIFGICLGHQLLALATGAKTEKLRFGNRGQNIPCIDKTSGRCYITSQNHGFAVNTSTLKSGYKELFVNANDGSNEGLYHDELPYFSVQFHPEANPGPRDTEFLFDIFIESIEDCHKSGTLTPIKLFKNNVKISKVIPDLKKVLVIGSGGLSIGQAGEFDYSGSQAIKALKEEGIYTILLNPNIATVQTSTGLADKVYFLPVTPEFVRKIIAHEHPDGIYVTFGGQTALNIGAAMKDEFAELGVRVLGTPLETIILTEDRDLFAKAMLEIGEHCAQSKAATSIEEAKAAGEDIGFPVIVRAAFALGGLGSGFAENQEELVALCKKAFAASPQVLIEKSMKGWKEIEYEVVRDCYDNCITVCNMENFDPLGIHTGDSIVVAPSQTLSDDDYHMLRSVAIKVIRHLGVVGECNIQYALNPESSEYRIIEVNARLSRSSALASKATGYPLAFVAAKLGLGIRLDQIRNNITKVTTACFEPSLDYVVVKMPRWDLKKFTRVNKNLSSAMKSVGEVMAIGRNFEETIQKAIRAVDDSFVGFDSNGFDKDVDDELLHPSDERIFAIAKAFELNYTIDRIYELTKIDRWFLRKLKNIHDISQQFRGIDITNIGSEQLKTAKQHGFSDKHIALLSESNEMVVRQSRMDLGVTPFVKQIDTVAAEFPAFTNYLYITYNATENDVAFTDKGVIVVGSGVYRIGSSVEFDWCAVHAIRTLRQNSIKTVMINYNPETVSTDYDEADRLYFENISLERVLDIYNLESAQGVLLSMGGQTANNIALPLHRRSVRVLGTSPEMIDAAENRFKFSRLLDKIGVSQPQWKELTSLSEAENFCERVSYPVLVRPSYVLSGAAMNVVYTHNDLEEYLSRAVAVSREFPVVITKFIENAKEIEVDAVARAGKLLACLVSEHVENAGVHSGDATIIFPPQDLDQETLNKIAEATAKIAESLNVTGPFNIQFIAKSNEIRVIECNLRASRSFPFVSKASGVDLIGLATKSVIGLKAEVTVAPRRNYVGVKVPQFSFSRLQGADPILGVEMASTGEVACFGSNKYEAYLKALLATGFQLPKKNILVSIGSFKEKQELLPYVEKLIQLGFTVFGTAGTADYIQEHGLPVKFLDTFDDTSSINYSKSEFSLSQHLANNLIDLYINLPSRNHFRRPASYMSRGYKSRRMAIDYAVPLITNVKCAKLFIDALCLKLSLQISEVDNRKSHHTLHLPGLVALGLFIPSFDDAEKLGYSVTKELVCGGFTMGVVLPFDSNTAIASVDQWKLLYDKLSSNSNFRFLLPGGSDSSNYFYYLLFDPVFAKKSVADIDKAFQSNPFATIITDAKGVDLASVLLLAALYQRKVHVLGLYKKEDLHLIQLSKQRGLSITCDVNIHHLYFTASTKDEALGSREDIAALWSNLDVIDCFSIGNRSSFPCIGDALAYLLLSVSQGKLKLDDLLVRLKDNPTRIFRIPNTEGILKDKVEIQIDLLHKIDPSLDKKSAINYIRDKVIHRTVINHTTTFLDGHFYELPSRASFALSFDSQAQINGIKEDSSLIVPQLEKNVKPEASLTTGNYEAKTLDFEPLLQPVKISLSDHLQNSPFLNKHILSVKDFSKSDLHLLFGVAQEVKVQLQRQKGLDLLKGRILCNLFYEPSTRTSCSFEAAMLKLGGSVTSVYPTTSSVSKGESLSDTIRTLASYSDAIVVRHPDVGSATTAASVSNIPIINAGDGTGEHPTQAFLDAFTIREELGTINGLTITMVGDLKNSRTVHSLVKILSLYQIRLNYVSPKSLRMPQSLITELDSKGINQYETESLIEVLGETDVLYVTRVQKERFTSTEEYDLVKNTYFINNQLLTHAKAQMIVMHPLPRVNEIAREVDFDLRAAYFRQMRHGLYVRMALLLLVLGYQS